MATYTLCPYEQRQYFDANGDPLAGGKVYTYVSGTSTPATTYANWTGTPNTNPVVLNAQGRARIYIDPLVAYKFVLTDANGFGVGLDMDPVTLNIGSVTGDTFQATSRGLVGAPAFTFTADPDTGIWSSSANTLDVSTAGVQRLRFFATGGLGVADGSVSAPAYSFASDTDTGIFRGGSNIVTVTAGGVQVSESRLSGTVPLVVVGGGAYGTGAVTGSQLHVLHNSSGGGAAAILKLFDKGGGSNFVWADASAAPGMLRISTAAPEEDGAPSDTSGTVVGTQASSRDTKDILGDGVDPVEALAVILDTPIHRFQYKGLTYSGTVFHGIVAEDSPMFAMDPDEAHPEGRSFNPVSSFGYTVQAFKAMQAQIDTLTAELTRLKETR